MITICKIVGLATVQDLGRVGHAAEAVPRGGALSRVLLRQANAAVRNEANAAGIEVLGRLVVRAETDVELATELGDVTMLHSGDELAVEPHPNRRARYLALAGGVSARVVLGSRSTLMGCFGDALRAGNTLRCLEGLRFPEPPELSKLAEITDSIHVVPGPDIGSAAGALERGSWRIDPSSDRRGTRLAGPPIPSRHAEHPSSPMVVGAIQLPPGGQPIVIGPDGPTTGGYPIIGVIARADVDRFHELPVGALVRFVDATLA